MSIGTNIKKRRYELGLSQQELADALGYKTRSTIAKIESDENSVTIKKLELFAKVLDTTVDELVTGNKSTQNKNTTITASTNKSVAIILAGGKSSRNMQNIPNQFINVLGKPLIIYPCEVYQSHPMISDIYIVCLKGWEQIVESYAKEFGITKLRGIITGGKTGALSVKNAIDTIKNIYDDKAIIVLQEATRPLVSEETISKVINIAKAKGSAVSCKHMDEYVQFLDFGTSSKAIDRNKVLSIQSPEAYTLKLIERIFDEIDKTNQTITESNVTMLLYKLGYKLNFCESNYDNNIKVVRQEDVLMLNLIINNNF